MRVIMFLLAHIDGDWQILDIHHTELESMQFDARAACTVGQNNGIRMWIHFNIQI
jgi:hypothetical protein